jgi:hypothetical protein
MRTMTASRRRAIPDVPFEEQIAQALEQQVRWVHPDGCLTETIQPMYPVCSHGLRAIFLGLEGDHYVGTATAETPE